MTTGRLIGGRLPLADSVRSEALIEAMAAAGWDAVVFASTTDSEPPARLAGVAGRLGLRVVVVEPALIDPVSGEARLDDGTVVHCIDVGAVLHDQLVELAGPRPTAPGGNGAPVVLLAGMLGDDTLWDDVAMALPHHELRCARIDLDDSVQEMARSVLADSPARFALVGHSLGAIVALEVARQAPERVTRVALVNASGRPAAPAQQDSWRAAADRVADGDFGSVADELALSVLPVARRGDASLLLRSRQMADTVRADGLLRQLAAQQTRPDGLAAAPAVTVPVLVVGGDADDVCLLERQRELASAFPRAELVVLEGVGHMIPLEAPGELAAHLGRWLDSALS